MRAIYKYILAASLVFLVIYLYKFNYFELVKLESFRLFLVATGLLFIGLVFNVTSWWKLLQVTGLPVSFRHAITSAGLTILSKYVPGKLWTIVGKASYLKNLYEYNGSTLLGLSFVNQVLAIISALFVFGIRVIFDEKYWYFGVLLTLVSLISVASFSSQRLWNKAEALIRRFSKEKKIDIVRFNWRQAAQVLWYFLGYWFFVSCGFYLLAKAMGIDSFEFRDGFVYPGCVIIGILALFSPGGLGIREGVLVALLAHLNYSNSEAVSLSLWSRLWFLIAEVGLFLSALVIDSKTIFRVRKK